MEGEVTFNWLGATWWITERIIRVSVCEFYRYGYKSIRLRIPFNCIGFCCQSTGLFIISFNGLKDDTHSLGNVLLVDFCFEYLLKCIAKTRVPCTFSTWQDKLTVVYFYCHPLPRVSYGKNLLDNLRNISIPPRNHRVYSLPPGVCIYRVFVLIRSMCKIGNHCSCCSLVTDRVITIQVKNSKASSFEGRPHAMLIVGSVEAGDYYVYLMFHVDKISASEAQWDRNPA